MKGSIPSSAACASLSVVGDQKNGLYHGIASDTPRGSWPWPGAASQCGPLLVCPSACGGAAPMPGSKCANIGASGPSHSQGPFGFPVELFSCCPLGSAMTGSREASPHVRRHAVTSSFLSQARLEARGLASLLWSRRAAGGRDKPPHYMLRHTLLLAALVAALVPVSSAIDAKCSACAAVAVREHVCACAAARVVQCAS